MQVNGPVQAASAGLPDRPATGSARGPRPSRPGPSDAVASAVRLFQRGDRVDVQKIAGELGVNRITVYRWVGTRESLLTEAIWRLCERTIDSTLESLATARYVRSHTAESLHRFAVASTAHPGVRRMWAEEEALFTRLLTMEPSEFQARLIAKTRLMLEADVAAGRVRLAGDGRPDEVLDDFAVAAVRLTETFVHTWSITGAEPESSRSARVLHALLRP